MLSLILEYLPSIGGLVVAAGSILFVFLGIKKAGRDEVLREMHEDEQEALEEKREIDQSWDAASEEERKRRSDRWRVD